MKKLFYNGEIHTMQGDETTVSILVEDGVVTARGIGPGDPQAEGAELVDLGGRLVVPGFHDSHMHYLNYAIDKEKVDFFNCKSLAEMAEATHAYIKRYGVEKGQWIQGGGWNENNFEINKLPTRQDLDAISSDHPMIFTRACCSVGVANTLALKTAGIFENPPIMDDGVVVVDENGVPTGMLEERARFLLYDIIPNVDKDYLKKLILGCQQDLLRAGLTTVQTDDFKLWDATPQDILDAYFELDREGKLDVRFIQQIRLVDHESLDAFLEKGLVTGAGSDFFKIGAYKLLPDGSLGGKTAALRQGYAGDEENRGILTYTEDAFYALCEKAHKAGMQLAMHAIGDRTMDVVLDCYERLEKAHPASDPRFRIIHCQITTEDIIDRFAQNNIIADIQPLFVRADMHVCEQLIGPERTEWSYNWKTLLDKGVHCSGSSDAPVEPFDPLLGIYAAVTRKDLEGTPPGGWLPGQKLSVQQAVALYTTGAAYTAFEEDKMGRLCEGCHADFIVLADNLFTMDQDKIKDAAVAQTYVGGRCVYDAGKGAAAG
ncbi:amidohydrolase [Ruminococcaceae bacterium OttesenSCG-928-A11]|nr:amidohydrolase [Ruminococcaceae bacterium OttesenSCG-928-A11]